MLFIDLIREISQEEGYNPYSSRTTLNLTFLHHARIKILNEMWQVRVMKSRMKHLRICFF
jgi:hypothetical protein